MTPLEPRKTGRRALSAAVVVGLTFPVSVGVAHAQDSEEPEDSVAEAGDQAEGQPEDADQGGEESGDQADQDQADDAEADQGEPAPEQDEQIETADSAVEATRPTEIGENQVEIPSAEGVVYTVAGSAQSAGTIVDVPESGLTIEAVAAEGYELTGQGQFHYDYIESEPQVETVDPVPPEFDGENVTIPETAGVSSDPGSGTHTLASGESLTVTYWADEGYAIAEGAQTSFTFTNDTAEIEASPEPPGHDPEANMVTVPEVAGVTYNHGPGEVIVPEEGLTVTASPAEGHVFAEGAPTEWYFEHSGEADEEIDPAVWAEGTIVRATGLDPEGSYTITLAGQIAEVGSAGFGVSQDGTGSFNAEDIDGLATPGSHTATITDADGNEVGSTEVVIDWSPGFDEPDLSADGTVVSIHGAAPNTGYTMSLNGYQTTVTTDGEGHASLDPAAEWGLQPGEHTINAYGQTAEGEDWSDSIVIDVADDDDEEDEGEDEEPQTLLSIEGTWLSLTDAVDGEYTAHIGEDEHTFSADDEGQAGFDVAEEFELTPGDHEVTVIGPDGFEAAGSVAIDDEDEDGEDDEQPSASLSDSTVSITDAEPDSEYDVFTGGMLFGHSATIEIGQDGTGSFNIDEWDLEPGEHVIGVAGDGIEDSFVYTVTGGEIPDPPEGPGPTDPPEGPGDDQPGEDEDDDDGIDPGEGIEEPGPGDGQPDPSPGEDEDDIDPGDGQPDPSPGQDDDDGLNPGEGIEDPVPGEDGHEPTPGEDPEDPIDPDEGPEVDPTDPDEGAETPEAPGEDIYPAGEIEDDEEDEGPVASGDEDDDAEAIEEIQGDFSDDPSQDPFAAGDDFDPLNPDAEPESDEPDPFAAGDDFDPYETEADGPADAGSPFASGDESDFDPFDTDAAEDEVEDSPVAGGDDYDAFSDEDEPASPSPEADEDDSAEGSTEAQGSDQASQTTQSWFIVLMGAIGMALIGWLLYFFGYRPGRQES